MQQLLKSSVWGVASVAGRAVGSLLLNKLFAVFYGPAGLALLAHFQNLVAMLTTLPDSGVNVGVIRHLAPEEPHTGSYRRWFKAGLLLNLLCYGLPALVLLLFHEKILAPFFENGEKTVSGTWLLFLIGGVFFVVFNAFLQAVLLARQEVKLHTYTHLLLAFCTLLLVWLAGREHGVLVALPAVLGGAAVAAAGTFLLVRARRLWPSLQQVKPGRQEFSSLGAFVLMALGTLVFGRVVDFVVRSYVIGQFGLYQTGLWQTVVKLSDSYTMLFLGLMNTVFYPKLSVLMPRPAELKSFVRQLLLLVLGVSVAGLLLLYVLQGPVLRLLFGPEFVEAGYLLPLQLLGDLLKFPAWLLAALVMLQARVRFHLWSEALSAGLYVALVLVLPNLLGLQALPLAHCIRYGAILVFYSIYFRRILF